MTTIRQDVLRGETEKNGGDGSTPGLPPYHLFEKSGERFVYVLSMSQFFNIEELTYRLLDSCLRVPFEEAVEELKSCSSYSPEEVADVVREAGLLAEHGLFDVPDWSLGEEDLKRQLHQRYSAPWTKLELALAETCNLSCTYCYCDSCRDMPNKGLMTQDVAKKAIDWLFQASGAARNLSLTLFGGEPLLNKPVFKFVMDYSDALAKEHGKTIRYSMTTNGTLIDDMVIHYIKKHNFGLMVSLDGPPEIHDKQCPHHDGTGSFAEAAAGIKRLMKRRKRVTVRCTMTNAGPRMTDLIRFFEDFGFTRIVLGKVTSPVEETSCTCDRKTFEEFERQDDSEVLSWIFKNFSEGKKPTYFPYAHFISERARGESTKTPSVFKCGACRGTTTIGADGNLYPCHRYVGMQAFDVGHIDSGPDINYAKEYWARYNETCDPKCRVCWARTLCNRPCPWEISDSDGGFRPLEEWQCDMRKRFFERAAYIHCRLQKEFPDVYSGLVGKDRSVNGKMPRAHPSRQPEGEVENGR
jgi:uncharacterized protein